MSVTYNLFMHGAQPENWARSSHQCIGSHINWLAATATSYQQCIDGAQLAFTWRFQDLFILW
jgi:hypothetical protein